MNPEYEKILRKSELRHAEVLRQMRHLSKLNKTGYDQLVARVHEEVFASIDCLQCGNCCRAMSTRFRETDIKRLCKARGMDASEFKDAYLKQDEDGVGFVLKELPCPLQNDDNSCSEYENRPLACQEFPHTQSRNIQRHLVGLALDSLVCPAAYLIAERLMGDKLPPPKY